MILLVIGVITWAIIHLFPAVAAGTRARLLDKLGRGPYRGLFSLCIAAAVVLMVLGWKSTTPELVYVPLSLGPPLTGMVMLIALILFFAARARTNIKRVIRHPQLTGVLVWAIAHLLSNGDSRSLVLFGGIGAWSVIQMIATNRRDGPWIRPDTLPLRMDLVPVVIGIVAYGVVVKKWLGNTRWIIDG